MKAHEIENPAVPGTYNAPKYHDRFGSSEVIGDVRIAAKVFTYRTELGLVVGSTLGVMFSVDHSAKEIWPYFKDMNLWQPHHYYTCVVGDRDMEGRSFGIGGSPEEVAPHVYRIVRVVPEFLIVMDQPVPHKPRDTYLPGIGGVSAGVSTFALHEFAGKTEVVNLMHHAWYAAREDEADEEKALSRWTEPNSIGEGHRKWRDDFIPQLRQAVRERRRTRA